MIDGLICQNKKSTTVVNAFLKAENINESRIESLVNIDKN